MSEKRFAGSADSTAPGSWQGMGDRRYPAARYRGRHARLPVTRKVKARFRTHDTARMRGAVRIALAILLLTACASATSSVVDNGGAATSLRAAAQKTLAADSFHVDATQRLPSGSGRGTVDYQAPDRKHDRLGTGKWATETISIGNTVYVTDLNRLGYFWTFEGHGSGASLMLMYVRFLEHAENVRLDGHLSSRHARRQPARHVADCFGVWHALSLRSFLPV